MTQNSAQTFPVDLAGYTTIGQQWSQFRQVANDDSHGISSPASLNTQQWHWPDKAIIFISDPHADADAFIASLLASGGVTRTEKGKLKLTPLGKKATFVIGGDCLDKGPSNLDLLESLRAFIATKAKVKLLAGNHDLRLLTGLSAISREKHVSHEHMFVRMGKKVIPLFKEVFERYLQGSDWQNETPAYEHCKATLYPRDSWFTEFPEFAREKLSEKAISKEIKRLRKKAECFEQDCLQQGLDLRMVYAAAQKCQQLFFSKRGKFNWFFKNMQLAYKNGSFLFVHAGLDDDISQQIKKQGIKKLNKRFKTTLKHDLFAFYFSSLATPFRTKYRDSDPVFTAKGVQSVMQRGIHCIVHGHVNHGNGQQISLQQGLLHVEGDITLDRNSRQKEGLTGLGFGATLIHPKQMIIGISSDHPVAKVLSPRWHNLWPQN